MVSIGIFAPNVDKIGDGFAPIVMTLISPQDMTAEILHVIVAIVLLCKGCGIPMDMHQMSLLIRHMEGILEIPITTITITSIVTIAQPVALDLLNVIIPHNHIQETIELRFVPLHRRHTRHNCLYLIL